MSARASASSRDDLFEAIAKRLEPSQREYFYQRMLYFRQLRPDDELLRIVEAMGFLALVIRDAPQAVVTEREQMAQALATSLAAFQELAEATQTSHRALEDRLTRLPADLAKGIKPAVIAQAMTESLRQQFVQSGLPTTAKSLTVVASQLTEASAQFQRSADQLAACRDVADEARWTFEAIRTSLASTTDEAQRALATLARQFTIDYRQAISLLCGAALLLGMLLGVAFQRWRAARSEAMPHVAAPLAPTPLAEAHSKTRSPVNDGRRRRTSEAPTGRHAEDPHGTAMEQR